MSNSPGMIYLPVRLTLLAAEKLRSKLSAVLLDTNTILFQSITIVVLGLGNAPVPSIRVAPSRITAPVLLLASVWFDKEGRVDWKVLVYPQVIVGEINSNDIEAITAVIAEGGNLISLDIFLVDYWDTVLSILSSFKVRIGFRNF
jgi:hypothetical protein